MIKFEKIEKYKDIEFEMPKRKTKYSAGYDFVAVEDIEIPSHFERVALMGFTKLISSDFKEDIKKSNYYDVVQDIVARPELYPQEVLSSLIERYTPEFIGLIGKTFTLNLKEMKELVALCEAKATLVPTGVKAKMEDNQFLQLEIRSSIPLNNYLILANGVGIVDSDYYNNPDNEGHIFFQIINLSPFKIKINKGDIIGQGIFLTYNVTEDDYTEAERTGGMGSTTAYH